MIWIAVLAASAASYLTKLAGLSVPERVLRRPWIQRASVLLPTALLAALCVTETFRQGQALAVDARAGGLLAAVAALRLRAPFLVVVAVATATTAVIRLAA